MSPVPYYSLAAKRSGGRAIGIEVVLEPTPNGPTVEAVMQEVAL